MLSLLQERRQGAEGPVAPPQTEKGERERRKGEMKKRERNQKRKEVEPVIPNFQEHVVTGLWQLLSPWHPPDP